MIKGVYKQQELCFTYIDLQLYNTNTSDFIAFELSDIQSSIFLWSVVALLRGILCMLLLFTTH